MTDASAQTAAPIGSLLQLGTRIPAMIVGAATAQALRGGRAPARVRVRVDAISESRIVPQPARRDAQSRRVGAWSWPAPTSTRCRRGRASTTTARGVAALLEVAKALGGVAPGAPIRLAFWGAEEPGLYGSTTYVSQLDAAARARVAAYLNLDMIGSRKPKRAVYSGADPGIEILLRDLVGPKAVAEDQARGSLRPRRLPGRGHSRRRPLHRRRQALGRLLPPSPATASRTSTSRCCCR